ncbi:Uu.00g107370.m01.CDS01 [Anthostomella pinea]|uniref:ubiquitinyl hydrolase 1 n=1 Tax=Anthostomella pinea TaxID=933095 RepID=A0AAI8YFW3_9PEZI|nr:Uu.00g107370.m01.CDS01 [Anthostomella pinea]
MALLCSSTFDVDPLHLSLVFDPGESVACFIETSIYIHDHQAPNESELSPLLRVSLQAWRRVCYHVRSILLQGVSRDRACLDQAVSKFWAAFEPGTSWSTGPTGGEHVVTSVSSSYNGRTPLSVCVDLLEGKLLVNGRPLSRLPIEHCRHPTYSRLFGNQILDITPSDRPPMEYCAARKQEGWIVEFGMMGAELLEGDVPKDLIYPYSHWIDIRTRDVDFRRVTEPWTSRGDSWRLDNQSATISLGGGLRTVIDVQSKTAEEVSCILESIEERAYVTIIFDQLSGALEIMLPRYDLTFTLSAGSIDLQSKHYRGLVVDATQSTGTLLGLHSQLVLRHKNPNVNHPRALIVPLGPVSLGVGRGGHPASSIRTPLAQSPSYLTALSRRRHHYYEVDDTLGRLVGKEYLHIKLLLCHLHAVTSHCLPDPLTGRTGTEEALRILRSAAVMSFQRMSYEDVSMLAEIAKLSPVRQFYPKGMMEMQQIQWSSILSPLAQDDQILGAVQSVLQKGQYCDIFSPDDVSMLELSTQVNKRTSNHLRDRATNRASTWRTHGFGAECHSTVSVDYLSRGKIQESPLEDLECRVCLITRALFSESENLPQLSHLSKLAVPAFYKIMGNEVYGPTATTLAPELSFDLRWLNTPTSSIGADFCKIQEELSFKPRGERRFKWMAFFGLLVFAEDPNLELIQLLLASACVPDFQTLSQPQHALFRIRDGFDFQDHTIRDSVAEREDSFNRSPESRFPQYSREAPHDHKNRQRQAWQSKVRNSREIFVANLRHQFVASSGPSVPADPGIDFYVQPAPAMPSIREWFKSWHRNRELDSFMQSAMALAVDVPKDLTTPSTYKYSDDDLVTAGARVSTVHFTVSQLFASAPSPLVCAEPSSFNPLFKDDSKNSGLADSETDEGHGLKVLLQSLEAMASQRALQQSPAGRSSRSNRCAKGQEQERELAPEIEQERQVEKPPGVQPEKHSLDPNVLSLVENSGVPGKESFLAAFRTFERSSMAHLIRLDHFGRQLLVTADFARTVVLPSGSDMDVFYRPVQWILSLESSSVLVVLSPYEANELLPRIEKSNHVRLRVYAPRHTLSLPSLQHLSLNVTPPKSSPWTAPRTEVMHLNLFAGQLYFQSMHEYRHACAYLGLSVVPNESSSDLGEDGFVGESALYPDCRFRRSPTAFLHLLWPMFAVIVRISARHM